MSNEQSHEGQDDKVRADSSGAGSASGKSDDNVRSLDSARPFAKAVARYQKAGWGGTLPLPAGKKNPPPTGFTGHKAPYPDKEQLLKWLNDPKRKRANICIRLAGTSVIDDTKWELVGIDVDHYVKGDKIKKGGDQLAALEATLGELPPTWTSSARTDGISGIRYYRVPTGLAFRGQVDKDIECIYKGYRFAVVWPSTNPDHGNEQYWWYPPNVVPDPNGRKVWDGETVPHVRDLPVLPQPWLDHLTQGLMRSDDEQEIDMDSSVDEIHEWADDTFNDGETQCHRVAKSVEQQTEQIREEATSHDKIVKSHWEMYRLAREGHTGWRTAVAEIEKCYIEEVIARDKRNKTEVRGEIFRSRTNALRKVKHRIDSDMAIGAIAVPSVCPCAPVGGSGSSGPFAWANGMGGGGGDGLEYVQYGNPDPPNEYRMNDDGNAKHFVDLFTSPGVGPGVRFVDGLGWIVWSSGDTANDIQPRWVLSTDGLIRRAWQRVRDRQEAYVEWLDNDFTQQLNNFRVAQGNPTAAPTGALKALSLSLKAWKDFAKQSGNNRNAEAALQAAKALPGVSVDINDLDKDTRLIGVANGVIELTADDARLRDANASDLITLNTNVAWKDPTEINKFGRAKWEEYLERFLPDEEIRRTAQVALGHCLIGGNPEKIFVVLKGDSNTGKSTMANMCAAALGDYAMTASLTIYQNHKLNPLLAKALTRRMVVTTELSETDKISASMLKRITGGSDLISAELKGSNVIVERVPQFVPIVATNSVPHIDGADKALRNRLYVIPFNVVVSEQEDDKEAATIMKAVGLEAILDWLVEGYRIYRREKGLPKDPRIVAESDSFANELDTVSTFIGQCIKKHPTNFGDPKFNWQDHHGWIVEPTSLFEAYWRWCDKNKVREPDRLSQPKFSRRFAAMGFSQKQIRGPQKNVKHWFGVKLVGQAAGKVTDITSGWQSQ